MACYMSAEEERVIEWKPKDLQAYVPPPASARYGRRILNL